MAVHTHDLWSLVLDRQCVDPTELAQAVVDQVMSGDLDYRTRLLIRDSVDALRTCWGPTRLRDWLEGCPAGQTIEAICQENFDKIGFPFLQKRLMESTRPETIRQFLRELGVRIDRPVRVDVGGSAALILTGYLDRRTDDVDFVDEVPPELRLQHQLLAELNRRYGLGLAHFQSHYLPAGWNDRLHSQAPFGNIHASLVDVYDVFLSKLFSARTKDRDDLRAVKPQLDKETLTRRLRDTTGALRADEAFRRQAEQNWYILYGEPLPS